jgi:hypothetical protein
LHPLVHSFGAANGNDEIVGEHRGHDRIGHAAGIDHVAGEARHIARVDGIGGIHELREFNGTI